VSANASLRIDRLEQVRRSGVGWAVGEPDSGFLSFSRRISGATSAESFNALNHFSGANIGHHRPGKIDNVLDNLRRTQVETFSEGDEVAHVDIFGNDAPGDLAREVPLPSGVGRVRHDENPAIWIGHSTRAGFKPKAMVVHSIEANPSHIRWRGA
jgi:hypothetical protein